MEHQLLAVALRYRDPLVSMVDKVCAYHSGRKHSPNRIKLNSAQGSRVGRIDPVDQVFRQFLLQTTEAL
jgi:hypothetical protein